MRVATLSDYKLSGVLFQPEKSQEYDVPRSWNSPSKVMADSGQENTLYDSPKHHGDVDRLSSANSSVATDQSNLYDVPHPSSHQSATSIVSGIRPSMISDSGDTFNSSSDRSSLLYDYPPSTSEAHSAGSSVLTPDQLHRYSGSPVYDNSTLSSYTGSLSSAVTKNSLSYDNQENEYDVVPATGGRSIYSDKERESSVLREPVFVPEHLTLESTVHVVVELQQLIHTSIARLNSSLDVSGYQAASQTLSASLSRLLDVIRYCAKRAAASGDANLVSKLDQQLSPLQNASILLMTLSEVSGISEEVRFMFKC